MRKLIYAVNLTLDGCLDHTYGSPDTELYEYYKALLRDAGTLLYGRKTYELMVPYWPDIAQHPTDDMVESDYAKAFVAVDNMVVFSKSLAKAEGENISVVNTDLEEAIIRLKQESGKNILTGGVDIPSQLIRLSLVDEFHFVVMPVVAGDGRRLLAGLNLPETLRLKLVESKIFKSGCVALHYVKT